MEKIIGSILSLIAVYALLFYYDGALFMQFVDHAGAWVAKRLGP